MKLKFTCFIIDRSNNLKRQKFLVGNIKCLENLTYSFDAHLLKSR